MHRSSVLLPATARSEDRERFAVVYGEVEPLEDGAVRIAFAKPLDPDRIHHTESPSVQRSVRRSTARIALSESLPHSASKTIAVRISSVREICWPSVNKKPSPRVEASNSAATRNSQACVKPMRAPTSSEGQSRGNTTRRASAKPRTPRISATFDEFTIDAAYAGYEINVNREEGSDTDQHELRRFADAEPEEQQRYPGERRDGAQCLQRRVEQRFDAPR